MKESFQEKKVETMEEQVFLERAREKFLDILKDQSAEMRVEGFPVNDNLRIDPELFRGIVPQVTIESDKKYVEKLEATDVKRAKQDRQAREQMARAEVLEMAKCILVNKEIFGGELLAVRTSKYDDFVNGVDELIFDRDTFEPMAAVDTTTSWETKAKSKEFSNRIKNGVEVRYGINLVEGGVKKGSYGNLPLFIIEISPSELVEVANGVLRGFNEEQKENLEKSIMGRLKKQAVGMERLAVPDVAAAYARAGKIFDRLSAKTNG